LVPSAAPSSKAGFCNTASNPLKARAKPSTLNREPSTGRPSPPAQLPSSATHSSSSTRRCC
jgi:hypothetical protein